MTIPGFGLIFPRADGHERKHDADRVSGDDVRAALAECGADEAYISRRRNVLLFLVTFAWTRLIGGMICGATTRHELTSFAAPRDHWDYVIARDGYEAYDDDSR